MLHDISGLPLEKKIKIRDALYNRREYIDEFINNQSTQEFNSDELAILKSWKHFEKGRFFIYKHLKMHSIFLNASYFSKQLKRVGLEKKWFGIIDNTVVASGLTKDQLHKNIAEIVPEDKENRVYIFKT
jgi:hypothetical protein